MVDYFGNDFILNDPAWMADGSGKAVKNISSKNGLIPKGGLPSGDSVVLDISLIVSNITVQPFLVNRAEVVSFRDTFYNVLTDIDSKTDEIPGNDTGGGPSVPMIIRSMAIV